MKNKTETKNNTKEENEEKKLLSPKLDVVFQALFGEIGSERITKKFLEAILERKIEEVDLSGNIVLRRENVEDKMGVLDVIAKINNNEYANIEMQVADKDNLLERILYYWARVYTRNIKKGEDYIELKKTIEILIVDFEIKQLKKLGYHSKWKIIEEKDRKLILTDDLEIHIIEINKIKKLTEKEKNKELVKWIYFLEEPDGEKVKEYMKSDSGIKEAKGKLETMSEDERMQILADLRLKAIMDEKAIKRLGYKEGLASGIKDGIKQGIKQGIEQGIEQGENKKTTEIAKKMKSENIDIAIIKRITGLTEEEIEKL